MKHISHKAIKIATADLLKKSEATVKVRLTGVAQFRIRFWLAAIIFRLAAKIIACNCEITIATSGDVEEKGGEE
jgi:hypothetical protein